MTVARNEREALCSLFDEVGPDAPTLCEGWVTRDLATHLVMRERRPDALIGFALKQFAGHTQKVQGAIEQQPWPDLVEAVRSGPPRWNPMAIDAVGELTNAAEFFVHHEDVRRAQPEWKPRPSDHERDAVLWRALKMVAKVTYRSSPVGVALRRPDGTQIAAKSGPRTVTISGDTGELVLHAFGREPAQVTYDGDADAVETVRTLKRGI